MVVSILMSFLCLNSFAAASASDVKAKNGKTTIDGVISDGEYGTEYKFDKDTSNPFSATYGVDPVPYSYYINWADDGLYIAYKANLVAADYGQFMPQLDLNPWNVIENGKKLQGLFFSILFESDSKVKFLIHNHDTVGKTGADGNKAVDLTDIEYKLGKDGDATILEYKLPVDLLRIKSTASGIDASTKNLEANQTFGFGAFLIHSGKGWGQVSGDFKNFEIPEIGLGTITLEAAVTPSPEATEEPAATQNPANVDDEDNDNDGLGTGAIIAIVVVAVVAVAVVIYFVSKKK